MRLDDGLKLDVLAESFLRPVLENVVEEIRLVHPNLAIVSNFEFDRDVRCDHPRISQLLSNLIGNAVTHGDRTKPIEIGATTTGDTWNSGSPTVASRYQKRPSRPCCGPSSEAKSEAASRVWVLGLYIASEIARVHGGKLSVHSDESNTRFTLTMPL
jgi:signal transduction histidine kinase